MEKAIFKPVFNRRKRLDNWDKAPVDIYCYVEGRRKYFSTGIRISKDQWRKGKIINHPNDIKFNYHISKIISDLEQFQMNVIDNTGTFTFDDLAGFTSSGTDGNFIRFLEREVSEDRTAVEGTVRYRRLMVKKLKDAAGDVTFKGLKYDTLKKFDNHMAAEGLAVSTRQKHHQQLRKYIGIAIKKGLVKENPYAHFKPSRPKRGLKKCLWYEDLDKIWELSYGDMYEVVRLKFIFSCYTGLRISDSSLLRWDDIQRGKIILKMKKTGQPLVVPLNVLSDRPQQILDSLGKDTERVFPKISDQVVNRELKRIGLDAGIPFPLNFHIARHTFCTLVAHTTGSVFKVMEYAGIYKVDTAMGYVALSRLYA